MPATVRIDKYLWAVRLFKTRSKATEACRSGKVRIGGEVVKPSREVREGDTITINFGVITKSVLVLDPIEKRVSASLAMDAAEDVTPQEEYDKLKAQKEVNHEYRQKGLGRPTKKSRRMIDRLKRELRK
jgi:ribosome-associated heat shock protein Hsp15